MAVLLAGPQDGGGGRVWAAEFMLQGPEQREGSEDRAPELSLESGSARHIGWEGHCERREFLSMCL